VSTHAHEGRFDAAGIALVPAAPGAYRLWGAGGVLFVGVTRGVQTLRSELRRHWRGDFGPSTQAASHFDCLVGDTPAEIHQLYLSLYLSSGLRDAGARRVRPNPLSGI
jgi:hypothetical protein